MCGRYAAKVLPEDIEEEFGIESVPADLRPRWNIAPTQEAPVVVLDGSRKLKLFRWGLIPHWAQSPTIGSKQINARAETLEERPVYREPFRSRRCLVVANGFYEWKKNGTGKIPMYIHRSTGRPMAFAGLWDEWLAPNSERVRTFTVITTTPNALMASIHDRMPVILPPSAYEVWLSPRATRMELLSLLRPDENEGLVAHAVSSKVNSADAEGPDLILPVKVAEQQSLF